LLVSAATLCPMPTVGKQLKRRNHTVNKSYLRRFADDYGQLIQIALGGQDRKLASITHATVVKNFYVVTLPDGTETDEAEDIFCELEGKAVTAIKSLVDDRVWPIPVTARRDIAPADLIKEMTSSRLHLKLINDLLPAVTEMLCERDWILTFFHRKSLATSDTPVVLRPAAGHPADMGIGIGNAGEVHVPLDRRVALSMGDGSTGDARCAGVTKTAVYLNDAMAKNARKYLFHHPEDDPFRVLELPGPRTRELASPEAASELVDLPQPVPRHWLQGGEPWGVRHQQRLNCELSLPQPESFGPDFFPSGISVVHGR